MSTNAISRAVFTARRVIPEALITEVFGKPATPYSRSRPNIDDEIARQVIRPRVIVDCDILGGQEMDIRVADCEVERTSDQMTVITVPKNVSQGRSITSVLSLSLMDSIAAAGMSGASTFSPCSMGSSIATAALSVMNSFSNVPRTHTGRVEVIGENTILVHDFNLMASYGMLKVIVANDENMNNLPYRYFLHFSALCTLAVKAHVYWKLDVPTDEAKIKSGFQIGAYRRKIDEYADAEQQYQDYLRDQWQKIAIMADRKSYMALVRGSVRQGA